MHCKRWLSPSPSRQRVQVGPSHSKGCFSPGCSDDCRRPSLSPLAGSQIGPYPSFNSVNQDVGEKNFGSYFCIYNFIVM